MNPLPIFIHYKNTIAYTNTLPIAIAYLKTLANTLVSCPTLSAANKIRARKTLKFVSQSESSITVPKNTRELSARVEDPSRLWARVGSL